MKLLTLILLSLSSTVLANNLAAQSSSMAKGHLFFDLGKVIVDTEGWEHVDYFTGTKDYLTDKIEKGYQVKLLVNFVDKLGEETYTNCEEKFQGVVRFLDGVWKGPAPFDWSQYQEIILPPTDAQRKPKPYMFVNALASACPEPAMYLGEDELDLVNSNFIGIANWKINATDPAPILPSSEEIEETMADDFRFSYPAGCQIELPSRCQLDKAKMLEIVELQRTAIEDTSDDEGGEQPVDDEEPEGQPESDEDGEEQPVDDEEAGDQPEGNE